MARRRPPSRGGGGCRGCPSRGPWRPVLAGICLAASCGAAARGAAGLAALAPSRGLPRRRWLHGVGLVTAGGAAGAPPAGAGLFGIGDLPPPADVAGPPGDAQVTQSGLAYKVLQPSPCVGAGCRRPFPFDRVTVDYTGWRTDGGDKLWTSAQRLGADWLRQLLEASKELDLVTQDGSMFDSSVTRNRKAEFGVGQAGL
ncbi:unnamed protein product [Prorocentrum cordatum]|uniref:Uncharacterized protein n=1 Tax=Prorocentrum cordatum TaxID=2364126 RepID=A0ABN9QKY4_9DINO|nr:unnamed protein product [Polarella glacialis]